MKEIKTILNQFQHKVSQVYLKGFGYKFGTEKNKQWKISTLEINKFETMKKMNKLFFSQKSIESVTADFNIFDIEDGNPLNLRIIENLSSKLENFYPAILDELYENQKLCFENEQLLIQFITSLICRTDSFRQLLAHFINSDDRENFIKHLSIFQEDKGESFIKKLNSLTLESKLNPVALLAMDYLSEKLITFDYIILKDYDNRGWITSDNPVVLLDFIEPFKSILSIDSKIIFPLSKDYCIYLYHQYSKAKNPIFDGIENKSVKNSTEEMQLFIYENIRMNTNKYLFFPLEINEKLPF